MLSKFIEALRKKRQFTQEYLAEQLNVSRPTYMQIEKGERELKLSEAQKLADIFGLTLENFLNQVDTDIAIKVTKSKAQKAKNEIRISIPQQKLKKFKQALLYILRKVGGNPNVGMTVLYKLLYFIDFDYYEKFEEQILGLKYIKNHHGPTPIIFKKVVDEMVADNLIAPVTNKYYQYEQKKYLINPAIEPDISIFNGREIQHIDEELDKWSNTSAYKISEYSHKDVPWMTAKQGEALDYEAVFYRTVETSVRDYRHGEDD